MPEATRIEKDSMGPMTVPAHALWGASTQRAVENFPISGYRFTRRFIKALGLIKLCAAEANAKFGAVVEEGGQHQSDSEERRGDGAPAPDDFRQLGEFARDGPHCGRSTPTAGLHETRDAVALLECERHEPFGCQAAVGVFIIARQLFQKGIDGACLQVRLRKTERAFGESIMHEVCFHVYVSR